MSKQYYLGIKTNLYAGNFEREMCAYVTGHIGDCRVGKQYVDEEIEDLFDGWINYENQNGCSRPVRLGSNSNNLEILIESNAKKELIELIKSRAMEFSTVAKINTLKILGFYLRVEETKSQNWSI